MSTENAHWSEDFQVLLTEGRAAADALQGLSEAINGRLEDDVEAAQVHRRVKDLRDHLDGVNNASDKLFERLCSAPVRRWLGGHRLTREEYHVMAAGGLIEYNTKAACVCAFDDFDVCSLFQYEDETRRCYINPKMDVLPPGRMRLRGGIGEPPEELSWDRLRPEQQRFFATYLPDVAARFKRNDP
ncbi:MAG TPA: hypothetical protein VFX12_08545 [Vicinamibacterales bacterium]|nr:hypothetical protein [Vicinamibacterales bacterium]